MIDIAVLRNNPELVKENIKKKFQDHKLPLVDEILDVDKKCREFVTKGSELRGQKNEMSKKIGFFMKNKEFEKASETKENIAKIDEELKELEVKETNRFKNKDDDEDSKFLRSRSSTRKR